MCACYYDGFVNVVWLVEPLIHLTASHLWEWQTVSYALIQSAPSHHDHWTMFILSPRLLLFLVISNLLLFSTGGCMCSNWCCCRAAVRRAAQVALWWRQRVLHRPDPDGIQICCCHRCRLQCWGSLCFLDWSLPRCGLKWFIVHIWCTVTAEVPETWALTQRSPWPLRSDLNQLQRRAFIALCLTNVIKTARSCTMRDYFLHFASSCLELLEYIYSPSPLF